MVQALLHWRHRKLTLSFRSLVSMVFRTRIEEVRPPAFAMVSVRARGAGRGDWGWGGERGGGGGGGGGVLVCTAVLVRRERADFAGVALLAHTFSAHVLAADAAHALSPRVQARRLKETALRRVASMDAEIARATSERQRAEAAKRKSDEMLSKELQLRKEGEGTLSPRSFVDVS